MLREKTGKLWLGVLAAILLALVIIYSMQMPPTRLQNDTAQRLMPATFSPLLSSSTPSSTIPVQTTTDLAIQDIAEALKSTSLRGTEVDRPVIQLLDGKLVLNGTLLFYFDYFLSLEGEVSIEDIRQWVFSDLRANYTEPVVVQIMDVFDRYLDYLAEVGEREAAVTEEDIMTQHLSAVDMQHAVKHHYFSAEEVAALFGGYDEMLGRPSMSSVQQASYEKFRKAISENPGQLDSVATDLFGAQAAQNLRNVQYARQQWEGRLANYRREKRGLVLAYSGDESGQQQAIALLQQRLFSEPEIRRVKSLEQAR